MMRFFILFVLAVPAQAETLVAARTIPAQTIIEMADLLARDMEVPGTISDPLLLVGMETRVALYAGRPIRLGDVGQPAIVERNQIVSLMYDAGGITVSTDGRSLERAGPGERVRVMNLSSRTTVTARIGPDGVAYVSP